MTKPASQTQAIGNNRGFTLVELVITIAVMSVALLGVAYSLQYSAQHGADSLWQTKAVELAQAYSDEILSKKFDHHTQLGGVPACDSVSAAVCSVGLGPEAGEQRSGGINNFDDVDDYHGLDDQPPVDALGEVRTGYEGYQVQVSVIYVSGAALSLSSNRQAKQIRILVTPPIRPATPVPFSVYRGNY